MVSTACATCGQPVASTAVFCGNCGRPVWRACTRCGKPINAQARYCGTCGSSTVDLADVPAGATAPMPPAQPSPMPPAPWSTPGTGGGRADVPARSRRRRPLFIGATLLVAVAIVAGGLGVSQVLWSPGDGPTAAAGLRVAETPMDGPTVIDVPTAVISSATVPATGRTIAAQGVTVVVPTGAVTTETNIVIQRLNAPFDMDVDANAEADAGVVEATPIGPAYDFGPAGTQFAQPVDVTLPFDATFLPAGSDPAHIAIAYHTGTHWAVAGGTSDLAAHTVTVRLQAFDGTVLQCVALIGVGLAAVVGTVRWYKGPNAFSDPVTRSEAWTYVTPKRFEVLDASVKASVGGVALSDQVRLAAYLDAHPGGAPITLPPLTPGASPQTVQYDAGPGTNWQMPDAYLRGGLIGDCTDTTNAMVSIFRRLGYPAKGVEGYSIDKDHPHAWGEVLIDGKPYMIDQNGMLQSLKEALELNHLIRPDETDPRNSMWDENGQARYQAQWWAPVTLAVDPATISDGLVGRDYPFKATATGIGGTVTRVNFSWDFGAGPTRENEVNLPYKDPLTDETTHSFPDEGGNTVTVVLYDTTGATPVALARATIPVRMAASTPTAAGGWELADVVIDHYLDVGNGVSIEGNGRGGIASVESWSADGTSASARLTARWQIPDRLAPGSRANLTGSLALTRDYQTVGRTCEDGTYYRGPQDGSLEVTVLNQAGAAPEFSDLVREVIRTGLSISVGCNTATRTVSTQDSAAGSFTVPDQITPAAGETAFLVVRFEVEHDNDRVRVAYIYKMPAPSPSASTDPCPPAAGGGPTCVQIAPDYLPGLSPTPSK